MNPEIPRQILYYPNTYEQFPTLNPSTVRQKAKRNSWWHMLKNCGCAQDLINDGNELAHFEAALALTNLASLGHELKLTILRNKGWMQMEYLCSSDNLQVSNPAYWRCLA